MSQTAKVMQTVETVPPLSRVTDIVQENTLALGSARFQAPMRGMNIPPNGSPVSINQVVQRIETGAQNPLQKREDFMYLQRTIGNQAVIQLLDRIQKTRNEDIHATAAAGVRGQSADLLIRLRTASSSSIVQLNQDYRAMMNIVKTWPGMAARIRGFADQNLRADPDKGLTADTLGTGMVLLKGLQFNPTGDDGDWINGHISVIPDSDSHARTVHFTGEQTREVFLKNFWYNDELEQGVPDGATIAKGGKNLGTHSDLGKARVDIKKLCQLVMIFG